MSEKEHLILTAIGPDHVGLVERISEFISSRGCNIEDSKMAVFYGEFAVIVLVTGEAENLDKISRDFPEMEKETGLSVVIKTPPIRKAGGFFLPYKLTASCMDHPGIVYHISGLLSSLGVNIESMETRTYSAPVSGTPLFQLDADVSVPARANISQLLDRLFELQREENIDIEFIPD